jgi:hypothetical protein
MENGQQVVKISVFISNGATQSDEKSAIEQPLNNPVKTYRPHNNDRENPDYSAGI